MRDIEFREKRTEINEEDITCSRTETGLRINVPHIGTVHVVLSFLIEKSKNEEGKDGELIHDMEALEV